jgi:hypothetical protein
MQLTLFVGIDWVTIFLLGVATELGDVPNSLTFETLLIL